MRVNLNCRAQHVNMTSYIKWKSDPTLRVGFLARIACRVVFSTCNLDSELRELRERLNQAEIHLNAGPETYA